MGFDGPALSFDDEGSILFDGEKIIVTVPVGHEALDHLGSEKEIPFPVVYTHPSHHQDQRPSTPPPPPGGNPVFNKEKARESVERARRARESARDEKSKSGKKDVKDDSPADRAPVTDKRDLASDAIDEEPAAEAVWRENTPLTPGQQMHVDNLLSIETDNLAREVLITLKREGLPPNDQWREFLEQYALTGWYAASDAIAWATLAKIATSEWDETLAYADKDHVETVAQDLGDNAIEGVVVIDAETGDTVLHLPGVVRADGSQYVGMQDTEADALLAEALSGRELIFVHNHPNGSDASEEDLDSAFRAGAKLLIVITPQGQEFVYIRGKYGMVKVRDEKASYEVGLENPDETKELRIRSEAQAWAFKVDAPEHIFRQEELSATTDASGYLWFYGHDERGATFRTKYLEYVESEELKVLGKAFWNHFLVLVERKDGSKAWLPLKDQPDESNLDEIALVDFPELSSSGEAAADIVEPYTNLVRRTVDFLPVPQDSITGFLPFGVSDEVNYPNMPGNAHPGEDIFVPAGTEVKSLTDGEVIAVFIPVGTETDYSQVFGSGTSSKLPSGELLGTLYDPRNIPSAKRENFAHGWLTERGGRAYIIVRSGDGYVLYGHLDPESIQVGTRVMARQKIGTVGEDIEIPGNDHLHIEVRTHGRNEFGLDEFGDIHHDQRPFIWVDPNWLRTEEHENDIRNDIYGIYSERLPDDPLHAVSLSSVYPRSNSGFSITAVVWPGE